jgi:hypothetical protein
VGRNADVGDPGIGAGAEFVEVGVAVDLTEAVPDHQRRGEEHHPAGGHQTESQVIDPVELHLVGVRAGPRAPRRRRIVRGRHQRLHHETPHREHDGH